MKEAIAAKGLRATQTLVEMQSSLSKNVISGIIELDEIPTSMRLI